MSFFKKSELKSSGSASPYLAAREEWLERYGSYISRAAQWRAVAFLCLLLTGGSVAGNVIQASQYKVVPYIVEVDNLGNAAAVVRADKVGVTPGRVVQAEIANFIRDWRTVTADIDLQKKMISRLSFFAAGSATGVLKDWYGQNNPYTKSKKGLLVNVEIKGLPLPIAADSYRVEWTEITRAHTGIELERETYEATAIIQLNPPTSENVILHNPGGVYITGISTGKVFSPVQKPVQIKQP